MNKQPLHARLAKIGAKNTRQIALEKAGLAEPEPERKIELATINSLESDIEKVKDLFNQAAAAFEPFSDAENKYFRLGQEIKELQAQRDKEEDRMRAAETKWDAVLRKAVSLRKQVKKDAQTVAKMAKDLGLDTNSIPALKEVMKLDNYGYDDL